MIFEATKRQAYHLKYGDCRAAYCAHTCRDAARREQILKNNPIPEHGPCPTCGKTFRSRRKKTYCCLECYLQSTQFQALKDYRPVLDLETRRAIAENLRTGKMIHCVECGIEVYQKKRQPRKFCSRVCYRAYMAKRFDRHIANPETIALPQCYDEFLDQEDLPCLVDGCGWRGKNLSLHMNFTHGIPREDFKRAAGFNLRTGVISRPLAELFQARELPQNEKFFMALTPEARERGHELQRQSQGYRSLEGREHSTKSRALLCLTSRGPTRICRGCGTPFVQSTPFGRALYCTTDCRDHNYGEMLKDKTQRRPHRKCRSCGRDFKPIKRQVYCSVDCRDEYYKQEKAYARAHATA